MKVEFTLNEDAEHDGVSEALAECWIEIDERWTRRDVVALNRATDEQAFELLKPKVLGCHLVTDDGGIIAKPALLTLDAMLDMDEALIGFIYSAAYAAIGKRRALGNVSARASSSKSGTPALH